MAVKKEEQTASEERFDGVLLNPPSINAMRTF